MRFARTALVTCVKFTSRVIGQFWKDLGVLTKSWARARGDGPARGGGLGGNQPPRLQQRTRVRRFQLIDKIPGLFSLEANAVL